MTKLVDQLRLAEKAAEDIYFARIDRELIEALHRLAGVGPSAPEFLASDSAPTRGGHRTPRPQNRPS